MSTRFDPYDGLPLDRAEEPTPDPFAPPGQLPFGTPAAAISGAAAPEQGPAPVATPKLAEPHAPAAPAPEPHAPGPLPPNSFDDAFEDALVDDDATTTIPPLLVPLATDSASPTDRAAPTSTSTSALLNVLAPALAAVALILQFVTLRWADGWWWNDLSVAVPVAGLAVGALLGVRRQASAPYLAVAVALPFALGAVGHLATHLRLSAGADLSSAAGLTMPGGDGSALGTSSSGTPDDPITAAVSAAVPKGSTATVHGYEVEVVDAACGLGVVENGSQGKEYWLEGSKKRFADASAAPGQEFCVITSAWTNTTSAPLLAIYTSLLKQVHTAEGTTYAPSEQDESITTVLNSQAPQGDVNPGTTVTRRTVVSTPSGSTVRHAVVQGTGTTEETWSTVVAFALD